LPFVVPLRTDILLAEQRRAAYGATVGLGGSPQDLRLRPRNEKFFTLCTERGSAGHCSISPDSWVIPLL
jgi:hypothetical protein